MQVHDLAPIELSDQDWVECTRLWCAVWPKDDQTFGERLAYVRERASAEAGGCIHLLRQAGEIVAVARSFLRTVAVADRQLTVLALASVCSNPDRRGQGLGAAVVRAAFARLDADAEVSLFQTGVPGFYERLGSRRIEADVINSASSERAFWDPYVMIHPGSHAWPIGRIDLLGPGW